MSACLVSEEPVLDAETGKARPLKAPAYQSCPVEDDGALSDDCTMLSVERLDGGLYRLTDNSEAEEVSEWRFRRIARGGYAAQVYDGDGYSYYYALVERGRIAMVFMQCASLPAGLRARLISEGGLEPENDGYDTCIVVTRAALVAAARAYHSGEAVDEDPFATVLTPAPGGAG